MNPRALNDCILGLAAMWTACEHSRKLCEYILGLLEGRIHPEMHELWLAAMESVPGLTIEAVRARVRESQ